MIGHPTALHATVLPDLVRGWCGPCEIIFRGEWVLATILYWRETSCWPVIYVGDGVDEVATLDDTRLDITRPECRAQLRLVLERGLRCLRCGGSGVQITGWGQLLQCRGPCSDGYLRAPVATSHLMPRCEGGSLPDAHAHHAPALLVAHATSVAAGGRGIVGLLSAQIRGTPTVRSLLSPGDTWPGYRVATDAEALAAGYAMLDADGTLRLPTDAREE